MDSDKEKEIACLMLQDIYEQAGKEFPKGWHSLNINKRISVLKEALDKNVQIIDTSNYEDCMEGVVSTDEIITK